MKAFVSVIIPTFRDWDRLRLCLDALCAQTYSKDCFEVIVVNNDPKSICPFDLPESNMKLAFESISGSYAARNTGIEVSKGEILAFTDSDCIPNPDWIEKGIRCLYNRNAGMVGGYIEFVFQNPNSASELLDVASHMDNERSIVRHSCAVTANLFVRREVFDSVGFFNRAVKSGGDIEFTQRASSNGFLIVFCADSIIKHPTRKFTEKIKKSYRVGKGLLQVELKRPAGFMKKLEMVILHLIPLTNPAKILRAMKLHSNRSVILFIKALLLSVLFGSVKNTGFFVSLILFYKHK